MKRIKCNPKVLYYGAIAILFLYAFRNVNEGIDVTDTGYHFSNFLYMSEMDPMWIFSTYLASIVGHFFTVLPGGNTLLGINIYTAIIPALLAVFAFIFFVKVVKAGVAESFLGILVALSLCWCPTTCVYNYMTYLFFGLGAFWLYKGLVHDKVGNLICAGVLLGLNVLVRFPNAAEAALIVVVWYACFLKKDGFKQYLQKTGWCLLGYILGLGAVFLHIQFQYGLDAYIEGIIRLFGMTENASDYTPYAMVYNIVKAYLYSGKWFLIIACCVVLGILGYMILPHKYTKLKAIGYFVCCLALVRWFYGNGMFRLVFESGSYDAILNWGVVFLMAALVFAVYLILNPKATHEQKLLSAIVIVTIGITPLGSNNQLYSNLNNMFLVLPFVFSFLRTRLKGEFTVGSFVVSPWPMRIMSLVCVCMLVFQSVTFGNTFVFRDARPRDVKVTTIPALKYMKTNVENGTAIETLGAYVEEAGLSGRSVLLFGDVPALSAYLGMPFVMSPWPDLTSYTYETFESELQNVITHLDENRPIIIFSSKFHNLETSLEENVNDKTKELKLSLLQDMIKENNYSLTFENEGYVIYE